MLRYCKNLVTVKELGFENVSFTFEHGWKNWVRPNLTSNDDYGLVSCNSVWTWNGITAYPYHALNGQYSPSDDMGGFVGAYINGLYWRWQLPIQIKISKFNLMQDEEHASEMRIRFVLKLNNTVQWTSSTIYCQATKDTFVYVPEVVCDEIQIDWLHTEDGAGRCFMQELEIEAQYK